jgi:hypothetical protein
MSTDEAYEPSSQAGVVYFIVDLLWMLFVLFVAAAIVAGTVALVRGGGNVLLSGDSISVKAELVRSELQQVPQGVVLTENPNVSVFVRDPTRRQVLLDSAIVLAPALIVGLVLWFLRGLTRSAKEGDPFAVENVKRLRGLGFALAFAAPVATAFANWARSALVRTLPTDAARHLTMPAYSIPFELIFAGMGAFILAAVFAYGVRLREDVQATV